jgi:hypothetical protein
MGASVSSNVTKLVTNAIVRTSNEIIESAHATQNQSIIISVKDTEGNVEISSNTIKQTATVSMSGLVDALNNSENNIKLDQQIAQMAKAIISGLNLAQLADANNTVDSLIKTCIEVKNVTTQQCMIANMQNINLAVEGTKGNVSIVENDIGELASSIQSCVVKAVENNKTLQDLTSTIKQASTSEAKGLSLAMIGLIIIAMALTGVGGIYAGNKIIFPAVLLGSIVSFVLYFQWTSREISSYSFVGNTISESNDCSISKSVGELENIGSAKSASENCQNDTTCSAYEWYNGQAVYYKNIKIGDACKSYYFGGSHKDNSEIIKQIVFKKGARNPTKTDVANAWLNTSDGSFWVFGLQTGTYVGDGNGEGWNKKDNFEKRPNRTIDWGEGLPSTITSQADGDVWIDYKNPSLLKIYTYTFIQGSGLQWRSIKTIQGVGPIINSNVEKSKSVGFAIENKKSWLLYLAVGLLIVGIIGLAFTNGMFKK